MWEYESDEEIGEDFLMRHDAGNAGGQHHDGAEADDPARPHHRDIVQVIMEAIEEVAALRVTSC